ncbi:MAG: hypothetical protein KBH45_18145 [Verrucomicrobia bacterium]|nr:hypothetical protein [Verrucomicrobiota bacterium]
MNFDPQKFFIGLMDFFSILLPGALLTYLLMGEVGPVVLGDRYARLAGAQAWAAFLFASYLFGHLIFLLGSWLDEFYDWARRYTLNTQITLLARRGRLLPWLARARLAPLSNELGAMPRALDEQRQRCVGTVSEGRSS